MAIQEIVTRHLRAKDAGAIEETAAALRAGQLVVIPTDTVYGVGVDAFNGQAIDQLYLEKERPLDKGIPVLIADIEYLPQVIQQLPPLVQLLAQRFWPGPLTLILPKHPALPANLSPNKGIAVRIPDCDITRAVIRAAGGAIATTSANLSGQPPAPTAVEALASLRGRVAIVLDNGPAHHAVASTIIDCTGSTLLMVREGPITPDDLARAIAGYDTL